MTLNKFLLLAAITLILLVACAENAPLPTPESDPTVSVEAAPTPIAIAPDPTATSEPTPTITAEPLPVTQESEDLATGETEMPPASESQEINVVRAVEDISIEGADGLIQQSTLHTPDGIAPLPGVILLHMLGGDRQVWEENGFAATLAENGYAVLTVDMRGHGATGGSINWELVPEDLQRVWQHFTTLEAVDSQRSAFIGASIGANLALISGAGEAAIKTAVLLSPGLDYRGVSTEEPIAAYGERPLFIVASEEDVYAADSSRTLAGLAQGETQLQMYNGAGHGTRMFDAQPELSTLILDWLAQNLN
ncbi:MAG: alpha/beta fold hydrolase [Anaerolineaceae bacterium]|nr:MAG: alpha/beta fold hydrolase [Anaerolineaceae bacterium]